MTGGLGSIIDYGSSWQIETTRGLAVGDGANPYYSVPEVLMEEAMVDERADQFSIAVVLFEMLTLELPYGGLGGKAAEFLDDFDGRLDLPSVHSQELQRMPKTIRDSIDALLARALNWHLIVAIRPPERFAGRSVKWTNCLNRRVDLTPESQVWARSPLFCAVGSAANYG